jgi:fatty acid desaturase
MLASASLGWGFFVLSIQMPFGRVTYLVCTVLAILALLRAVLFIHELAHLKRSALPGFETAWLVLVGFPLMVPSIMYDPHGDHHRQATFGTADDPEYLPLAQLHPLGILWFVVQVSIAPVLLALRWGIIGPIAAGIPALRRLVINHASTLVINPHYRRALPSRQHLVRFTVQEIGAGIFFWLSALGWYTDWIPLAWLLQWLLTGAGILVINQIRTLAAHRYENQGEPVTTVDQVLDSINLRGWPVLTALAAPVGLRYHALHHFLPTVPYHSLGYLHRQLQAELPADSPYWQTEQAGILSAIRTLIKRSPHLSSPPSPQTASDSQTDKQALLNEDCAAPEA